MIQTAELSIDVDELRDAAASERGAAEPPPERAAAPRSLTRKAMGKIQRRRNASIRSYIGPNGSGKSALMVMDVLPVLDGQPWKCTNPAHLHTQRGIFEGERRVLSTIKLLDGGQPHRLYDPLSEWRQVIEAEHADIVLDEITGVASSRASMGMPLQIQNKLNQLRRADTPMSWSAPNWARADSIIRGCTQLVTDCRGFFPDRSLLKGDAPPAWLPKRLFKARSFNAVDFDEWTAAKASQNTSGATIKPLRPSVVQWWWGPGSRVFSSYDTLDSVNRVGEVLDSGRCADCGGTRQAPKCFCPRDHALTSDAPEAARPPAHSH